MPIARTLILFCTLLVPHLSDAAEVKRVTAAARLTNVTVYPDQAMTTRTATMPLQPGSYMIVFDNLPVLVRDDSVRVEGKGSAQANIVGMEVVRGFTEQIPEKRVKELTDEIQVIERKRGALDSQSIGLANQKKFIESLRVAWSDRISKELAIGKPTVAELNEALGFIGSGMTKVEEQSRELEIQKRLFSAKIDALQREREQATGSRQKESKSVEVGIEVAKGGELILELSAVTGQATWEPSYDVRLASDGKSAQMTFRAMVAQQTGEEWNNVSLSLSTARPSVSGTPPELYPWRVAFFRPIPPPAPLAAPSPVRAKKARASTEDVMGFAEEAPKPAEPATFLTAQISEEQTSVLFQIQRKVDIPSDGSKHGNVVTIEKLPVKLEFLAIPKLSQHVFLKSELVNQANYPLLPGRVNIFTGGNFTGSSSIKKVAAGEKFDLFFGTDEQLTVKREELKRHSEAGLFGKNRMEYRYKIEVQNFRNSSQTITIQDQLPLPSDDEIRVNLEEPSIKPDEIRGDGRLSWKMPLQAGEKRDLLFGIRVEYPKDRDVSGL
jgi:uncharacterized protein (TIGR02231 family)